MDYDFSRLSTRTFEQMVQSLALTIMGGGVNIFGDGPDGGREATFEDVKSFPDSTAPWTGYGVIQAKFRQKPGVKDSSWAVKELKDELDKISTNTARKPEYYIFVTNVVLTPVANTGGKDKLTAVLNKYKKTLGLKDFRIWDRDQLCAFLDICTDVRTAYRAWITPGDVLSKILEHMAPKTQDFREVMLNFVQKELRGEQYVNLGQAGHSGKDRVQLASVFVDLPIAETSFTAGFSSGPVEHPDEERATIGVIHALSIIAGQKLDPETTSRRHNVLVPKASTKPPGKIVFIGGPGQGKSTLTQFFCQLHRSAFIIQHSQKVITSEIKEACDVIFDQCSEESISPPKLPRFPLRIELNKFAAALANEKCSSLFNYILHRIKEKSERDLKSEDLRKWLSSYPWIIALDGLDEVPASSNRSQVLDSVHDFLIDANDCNADLLLIATSRPQGYDDDFSDMYYNHYRLCELTADQALHYAKRLIVRKCGDDTDKIQTLTSRMERASNEPATIRLMKSPLQVTIMALLVESLGEPPKERWRLFNEYYQVINRREKERDIPAAKLLNSFQADIDFIHQKVGANLQIKSEKKGGTEALLSEQEFSEIIINRLKDEGHDGEKGEKFKNDVIEAALLRLVFLVAPQEGRIGFEIRSLQEFMAAQYISSGNDIDVSNRLKSIAHATHWRNVFLFAAGRCFHERQHLRDSIFSICSQLNDGMDQSLPYDVNKLILSGSEIALDIIDDGAISNQPAQLRIFARLAIRLVELPPCDEQMRLAGVYQEELKDLYVEAIEARLNRVNEDEHFGAWHLLLNLINRNVGWASGLAKHYWPTSPRKILKVATTSPIRACRSTWIIESWLNAVLSSNPSETALHMIPGVNEGREFLYHERLDVPQWLRYLVSSIRNPHSLRTSIEGVKHGVHLQLRSSFPTEPAPPDVTVCTQPVWRWLLKAIIFSQTPSRPMLAQLLSEAADIYDANGSLPLGNWLWLLPWQLGTIVKMSNSSEDFREYSKLVDEGFAGDEETWKRAMERWQNSKILVADLTYLPKNKLPYDHQIDTIGFPSLAFHPTFSPRETLPEVIDELLILSCSDLTPQSAQVVSAALISMVSSLEEDDEYQIPSLLYDKFLGICKATSTDWFDIRVLNILPPHYWYSEAGKSVIEFLASSPDNYTFEAPDVDIEHIDSLASAAQPMESAIILLSKLTYVGRQLKFSLPPSKVPTESKPALALAYITLGICDQNCTPENASRWATMMTELYASQQNGVDLLYELLSSLQSRNIYTNATERFIYEIMISPNITDRRIKANLVYLLKEHQKYHLSNDPSLLQ
ncbi:NACHT domain-containing protein [Pseudomonas sp. Pseu.R1]|uniref:NACHT domain-containing protein n=1 Tax=Pseudomonas sp. Pseu.R1 TaxID=3379818 RepID=UPI003B942AA7